MLMTRFSLAGFPAFQNANEASQAADLGRRFLEMDADGRARFLEILARDVQSEILFTGAAETGRFETTGSTGSLTGRIEAASPPDA